MRASPWRILLMQRLGLFIDFGAPITPVDHCLPRKPEEPLHATDTIDVLISRN